ncbi:glycosyltransferase family A protein [Microbacterium sp. BG28]|uniref:glycosyltransferase family 2 protein n=1 Tax=Microbacterium sp. BG28 TaxID=3097356 RepID=UPI002A5AA2AC|nr:glycosyltransferase family A protein [Microbacterium sp. BG28]MDY0830342.1 glycosyltransferase family A protein [Microbacterium sp. BG28]
MNPRVAVIVRTKDRPEFLARALADIASQTYREAEIVVVNDQGDARPVADTVAASAVAERVRVVETVAPGGRCAAANLGLRSTDAEFVVLHDDDDRWASTFLERTVAHLDVHPSDAGVMTATEIVYERREGTRWVECGREPFWRGMTAVTFSSLLEVNRAVPISFLYRRALHDEVGYYDESLETVEDWEFYLRVTAAHPVGFLAGEPLAFWTQRPGTVGADANSMFELSGAHARDDAAVRDAALREWVARNGAGLPLYLAAMERRLREEFARELEAQLARQREEIVAAVYDRHPLWRRLRRLRRGPAGR